MVSRQVVVFLDRDGVINEEVDMLYRMDQLRLVPGVSQAIGRLNSAGLPVVVVTNQPVVARGLCTEEELQGIHKELERRLNTEGAYLDAIYFCPHHEEADLLDYRKACPDRNPGTGMIQRATEEFNCELGECFVVGDRTADIQMGKDAGCHTILVETGYGGNDGKYPAVPDVVCKDLPEAVSWILEQSAAVKSAP